MSSDWNFPLKIHSEQKDVLTNYKEEKPKPNVSMSKKFMSCTVSEGQRKWTDLWRIQNRGKTVQKYTTQLVI